MYTLDNDNIWSMLENSEAQYNSVDNAIDYIGLINPAITAREIRAEYNKYISYCVKNDLI